MENPRERGLHIISYVVIAMEHNANTAYIMMLVEFPRQLPGNVCVCVVRDYMHISAYIYIYIYIVLSPRARSTYFFLHIGVTQEIVTWRVRAVANGRRRGAHSQTTWARLQRAPPPNRART